MKKTTWFRLDNAAKIYPPTANSRRPHTFALSAVLKEKVDREVLNDAVNVVLHRFPTFKVKLRRGVFWYYLEQNKKTYFVEEESPNFLGPINEAENNDYLFKVFYFENKITLTIFHALTDGAGGMEVLKAIVFEYLLLKGHKIKADNELKTIYSPPVEDESDDTFLKVFNKKVPKPKKEHPAFKMNGTQFAVPGTGIITARMPVEQVKNLAKKYNTTITGMFAGLLVNFIHKNYVLKKQVKNKHIKVLVPVNLRNLYSSKTVRNFAMFTRTGHDFAKSELDLEQCIQTCSSQLKQGTQKQVLDTFISSYVKTAKNPVLKLAPLFLKDIAMKIAYSLVGENLHTTTLSNLGVVCLPPSVKDHVKDFIFTLGVSSGAKFSVAVVSYDGFINITFSRGFVESYVEKDLIRFLTENNVDVELYSNYWEDN